MALSMSAKATAPRCRAAPRRGGVVAAASVDRRSLLLGTASFTLLGQLPASAALPKLDPSIYGDAAAVAKLEKSARAVLRTVISGENAGNLLRMAFHDAGTWDAIKKTGGADGSLRVELARPENGGLKYGQAILDGIKDKIDGPITWADLYQLAGAEAVEATGGPHIEVALGRPDSNNPEGDPAGQLPSPDFTADEMIALFERNGYTVTDVVALSGSHTLGSSRKTKPKGYMEVTPAKFDNSYYKFILEGNGAFFSDRDLVANRKTRPIVEKYAKDEKAFFDDFAAAYIKMGLKGLTVA